MPRSPVALIIALSATLFAAFALNSGASLQSSLLALRASAEGFAPIFTGIIMASYYIGFVAGIVWGASLVNRVGHIRTFAALASTGSAITLLHAVFVDPITWSLFRALTGLCVSGLYLVIESWLNAQADNTSRGGTIAIYMTVSLGGLAIGQLLLNVSPISSFELFTVASVLLSLSLVPLALTRQPPPTAVSGERMTFRRLYNISPLGFVAASGAGVLSGAIYGVGPVFAADLGLPTHDVAYFMFFVILGGMIMQFPIGKLSDMVPRQYVMIVVLFGLAICGLIPLAAPDVIRNNLTLWGGITGVFIMPIYGLAVAYVNDYLEPEDIVPASGGLLIIYGASAATGPLLGASAIGHMGPWALPVCFAIIGICVASFAIYRAGFGRRISIEEQGQFVAVPRTTPMAFELSPITDDPGQDQEDGQTAGSSPLDPDEIAEMMTPDGTAHPDDFGQVTVDDPQPGDDTERQSGSGSETGPASGSTSR
ncbi:MFS transporter [Thalassospira povalilytica]|uniref:MFS transporter n=1 Tax=Thalassospira povalilytica TaxID=732237 RepID=UPI003AA82258